MSNRPKPTAVEYLAAFVEVNFTLTHTMRALQKTQGGFTYTELAEALVVKYEIPVDQAREMVWEFVTNMNALIDYDGQVYHLVEPPAPSINDTVAEFATMAATLKPRRVRRPAQRLTPPQPHRKSISRSDFEQFRPRRSADKWLREAPDYVIGCYDNAGKRADRYTILFGGTMWSPSFAYANFVAGVDPRVAQCLSMSSFPELADGVSVWGQCLATAHLGKKIAWLDLPGNIREHVIRRAQARPDV